jgi:PUA-domain protein
MSMRTNLREKDAKAILTDFKSRFDAGQEMFGSKPHVQTAQLRDGELIFVNGSALILRKHGQLIPALKYDAVIRTLPHVVVDMGAIPHVCNGADVMAKGIRKIEGEFEKGDLIVVVDEKYGKNLAIGEALEDSTAISTMEKGKVVSNLHYVGDDAWNAMKE